MIQELISKQVCDIVIDKLHKKLPYFVMRMGDGDTIMSQPNKPEWREWFERVSKRNIHRKKCSEARLVEWSFNCGV
jgi:hypothetical protein